MHHGALVQGIIRRLKATWTTRVLGWRMQLVERISYMGMGVLVALEPHALGAVIRSARFLCRSIPGSKVGR